MGYLTTKQILDDVQALIVDQSAALRIKMLTWLNLAMQLIINQPRDWEFLKKSATVTITANVITIPTDYGDFISLACGDYFFKPKDILTDEEVFLADGDEPIGITIDELLGTITIVPSTSETTATLKYKMTLPAADYTDSATATIFPKEFRPLFARMMLTARNEFDEEDQWESSLELSTADLYAMKRLDNRRKGTTQPNSHGYTRGK